MHRSEVIKWRHNYSISKETLPKSAFVEVVSRTVCRRGHVIIVAVVVIDVEKIREKVDYVSRGARTDQSSIISFGSARDSVGNVAKALSRYSACSCPSGVYRDPPWGKVPFWGREENRTREQEEEKEGEREALIEKRKREKGEATRVEGIRSALLGPERWDNYSFGSGTAFPNCITTVYFFFPTKCQ